MNDELTPGQKYEQLIQKSNVPAEYQTNADFYDQNIGTSEGKELIKQEIHTALNYRKSFETMNESLLQRLNELQKAIHGTEDVDFLIESILDDL